MKKQSRAAYAALVILPVLAAAVAVYLLLPPREATSGPVKKTPTRAPPVKPRTAPAGPGKVRRDRCSPAEEGKVVPLKLYLVSRTEKAGEARHPRADQRPRLARLDEAVYLYAVLRARYGGGVVYFTAADRVRIGRAGLPGRLVKPWPLACQPSIRWYKVEPTSNNYSYVKRSNPIAYAETPFARGWRVRADVHPNHLGDQFKGITSGVGVMRFKATLELGSRKLATPGKESLSNGGISKNVLRVTHRPHTGKITDYALELFNTPYIWGSMEYQVNGQIGVDCADLMVYALRRSCRTLGYTWSKGLVADRRRFARVTDGKVKVGDILYHGRHVGMLHEENGDGVLDGKDKVVHTLFHEPEIVTVKAFGWPEVVLRWRGKAPGRGHASCR